jgi:hypothetical protein
MDESRKGNSPRKAVIGVLSRIAPLEDWLASLLAVPSFLYDAGRGGEISFSSGPDLAASSFAGCFFMDLPLPGKIPEYAIGLSRKGSALYCTLVDKKRKIIVNAPVSDSYSAEADWEELGLCIRKALRKAAELESSGKAFNFVMASPDTIKIA